jgi:hypothetical protein
MIPNLDKTVSVKKGRFPKTVVHAAAGLALLLLGATTARAADMCLIDDYNTTLVGYRFRFPAPNQCKPFDGYELGTNCLISGTACGTAFGEVRFNLTTSCPFGYFGTSSFHIDRLYSDLYQAGFGYACSPNTGSGNWTCTQWHIRTIPCPNPHSLG